MPSLTVLRLTSAAVLLLQSICWSSGTMVEFIFRRLGYSLLIVLGVLILTFLLFNVGAGDPAGAVLGKNATPSEVDALRRRLGSDLPLFYGHYCLTEAYREIPAGSVVLAGADVGAAMGSGADAAIEAADVVFMTSSVEAIPQAIRIARSSNRIAVQNVVFALAIKIAVMLLANSVLQTARNI